MTWGNKKGRAREGILDTTIKRVESLILLVGVKWERENKHQKDRLYLLENII